MVQLQFVCGIGQFVAKVTGEKGRDSGYHRKNRKWKKASCKITVIPKTNKIKKLKKSGSKGIKISWSKISGVSKYQIYMRGKSLPVLKG